MEDAPSYPLDSPQADLEFIRARERVRRDRLKQLPSIPLRIGRALTLSPTPPSRYSPTPSAVTPPQSQPGIYATLGIYSW